MSIKKPGMVPWDVEHMFAVGFAMLVPVFMLGVVATLYENGVGLTLVFGGFAMAGVVWIRQELPAAVAQLARVSGVRSPLG